jgi:uncharacterized OsmC-like protein
MLDLKSKPAVVPSTPKMVNGINVTALRQTIDAVSKDASVGATSWKIKSRWTGGTRSDHLVEGCMIGGQEIHRPFTIRIDEPLELCGTNQFANPQEYLLSAMNACMMVGYAAVAALMGIRLSKLEVETTGDIDLRGFLGIRRDVPAGYGKLEQVVRISGSGTDEQFAKLHETILATSPNFYNITRAIPTNSRMEVVR